MLKKISVGLVALPMLAGQAFAAVPADVTSALESAKTDGVAVATAVLVAVVAIYAFKLMRKGL